MATNGQLNLIIAAQNQASSVLSSVGSALGHIATTAAGMALGSGITDLPNFLSDAAKAASEDSTATDRLNQALGNLGGNVQEHVAQVNDAIAAGQKLAYSDDDVRDSFQTLLAATGDVNEAMTRQKAAMDLARGANIPLSTATKMLGKLNADNVEVFKKMGIVIGKGATEADALAAVQKRFGGQAETYAKSTAGQFEQAQIALSEVKESIGYALLPVLGKIGGVLAANLPAIQEFAGNAAAAVSAGVTAVIGTFTDLLSGKISIGDALAMAFGSAQDLAAKLAPALQGVVSAVEGWITTVAVPAVAAALPKIVEAVSTWAATAGPQILQAISQAMGAGAEGGGPLAGLFQGIQQAVAFLKPSFEQLVAAVQQLGTTLQAQLGPILTSLGPLFDSLKPVLQALATAIAAVLVFAIKGLVTTFAELASFLNAALPTAVQVAKGAIDTLTAVIRTISTVVGDVVTVVRAVLAGDWAAAWTAAQQLVQDTFTGISTIASTMTASIGTIIKTALSAIGVDWDSQWAKVVTTVQTTLSTVESTLSGALGSVESTVSGGLDSIHAAWQTAWNLLPDDVRSALNDAVSAIANIGASAAGTAQQIGSDIVSGLVGGITARAGEAAQAAVKMVTDALASARAAVGAHSPSLEFEDLGDDIVAGLNLGILRGTPAAESTIRHLLQAVLDQTPEARQYLERFGETIRTLASTMPELASANARLAVDQDVLTQASDRLAASQARLKNVSSDLAESQSHLSAIQRDLGALGRQYQSAELDANKEMIPLQMKLIEAQEHLRGVRGDDAATQQAQKAVDAIQSQIDAMHDQLELKRLQNELDATSSKKAALAYEDQANQQQYAVDWAQQNAANAQAQVDASTAQVDAAQKVVEQLQAVMQELPSVNEAWTEFVQQAVNSKLITKETADQILGGDGLVKAFQAMEEAATKTDSAVGSLVKSLQSLPDGTIPASGQTRGFASGGVVPGAMGAPMLAIVHGGEEVLTPGQRRNRGGGGGGGLHVTVNNPDAAFNARRFARDLYDQWQVEQLADMRAGV